MKKQERFPRNGRGVWMNSAPIRNKGRRPARIDRINHVRGVLGLTRAKAIAFLKEASQ